MYHPVLPLAFRHSNQILYFIDPEFRVVFTVDGIDTNATETTIGGQAADNPPTFVNSSNNITARATTAAAVNWSVPGWTTAGAVEQSPDLTAIIQEIVDRPGWASGNALVLITTDDLGKREAISFERDSTNATLLHVEYTAGVP